VRSPGFSRRSCGVSWVLWKSLRARSRWRLRRLKAGLRTKTSNDARAFSLSKKKKSGSSQED
jgi:hypothetical protein